jgi:hypothetical protein
VKGFILACLLPSLLLRAEEPPDLAKGRTFYDLRSGEKIILPPVTPENILGYELLYATPGTGDIAEIAGHLLLRVNVKPAPDAIPIRGQHAHDLVISYLADTGETPTSQSSPNRIPDCRNRNWLNLVMQAGPPSDESPWASLGQSLKGLSGGFEVTQDIQTLEYTLRHYTVAQNRTLLRYPLNLSHEQIQNLTRYLAGYPDRPPPHYYFFHRNCASVLVQELGEGLQHETIRSFQPNVSPPHTLVALLIREGIASTGTPPFLSFRDRGYSYQRSFHQLYPDLIRQWPDLPWPRTESFLDASESNRNQAVMILRGFSSDDPNLTGSLYRLGGLLQDMELAYDPRDRLCRDFTSSVTAEARNLQADVLNRHPDAPQWAPRFPLPEPVSSPASSLHTGLYRLTLQGIHRDDGHQNNRSGMRLQAALLTQEMGSPSALAMQRAGYVTLGGLSADLYESGDYRLRFTGLDLRKFQEELGQVRSGLTSSRGWGLGLSVLNVEQDRITQITRSTLGGIAGLVSIASAPQNRHYLFLGIGLDLDTRHRQGGATHWGVEIPVQAESLITLGNHQWRNRAVWRPGTANEGRERWEAESSLLCPLGEWWGTEVNGKLSGEWREENGESTWQAGIGIELNRF